MRHLLPRHKTPVLVGLQSRPRNSTPSPLIANRDITQSSTGVDTAANCSRAWPSAAACTSHTWAQCELNRNPPAIPSSDITRSCRPPMVSARTDLIYLRRVAQVRRSTNPQPGSGAATPDTPTRAEWLSTWTRLPRCHCGDLARPPLESPQRVRPALIRASSCLCSPGREPSTWAKPRTGRLWPSRSGFADIRLGC